MYTISAHINNYRLSSSINFRNGTGSAMLNIVLLKYEPYAILLLLFSFHITIFFFLTRRVFNTHHQYSHR